MICNRCEFVIPKGKFKCPSCGGWQLSESLVSNDETVLLKDIRSAEEDRLDVGEWNYCWGGGLIRTSVTFWGGLPGAGKSTGLLQILDIICRNTKKETMYIATEEALEEIKARAERVKVNSAIRFVPAMTGVGNIGALLNKWLPAAIVVDSLQGVTGGNDAESIELLKTLKKISIALKAPTIVISHVTKAGDHAGLMTFQHAVDTLWLMSPDESGERCLEVQKNRFGRAFIESYFEMTESGLVFLRNDKADEEETEDDDE